jgi:magnesium and cobalt transporter|tara:strand:+ start:1545 stop:2381 length:837 start_codon:yes stop_codon:yes gene_type:complete
MIKKLFKKNFFTKQSSNNSLKQSIETVLDTDLRDAEGISKHERLMLLNILKIDGIRSSDIMIPRADIVAVEINDRFEKVLEVFINEAHSRVPVYENNLDSVIGMVHIKDLVNYQNSNKVDSNFLKDLKRDILQIPPSMPVLDLLLKMQMTRLHMGIVIDEYGCTDGLITIEDVIEEITGEIEDEHDEKNLPMLIKTSTNTFEASARVEIQELQRVTNLKFLETQENEDIDTLGGLIFSIAGRVPQRGEIIKHNSGTTFEIKDADPMKIKTVQVSIPKK